MLPEILGALEVGRHSKQMVRSYSVETYQNGLATFCPLPFGNMDISTLATGHGKRYGDLILTGHIIRCIWACLKVN